VTGADILAVLALGWAGGVATACVVVVATLPPRGVFRGSTTPTYPRPAAPQPRGPAAQEPDMGRYESNSGNEKKTVNGQAKTLLAVGCENAPNGGMFHVAMDYAEGLTVAEFADLRTAALDSQVALATWWASLVSACSTWADRVATKGAAAGYTQAQWRQMARDAAAA
jgi:hypothetical protein